MKELDHPKDDPNEALWRDLMHAAMHEDGAAAQEHLQAGFPIYYIEDDTPEALLIKEYPGGRRELVRFDESGDEIVKVLAERSICHVADHPKTDEEYWDLDA